jgi:hypothetical protein
MLREAHPMNNKQDSLRDELTERAQPAQFSRLPEETWTDVESLRNEIARQAYFLYVREGCPQGNDVRHWLEVEARLMEPPKPVRGIVFEREESDFVQGSGGGFFCSRSFPVPGVGPLFVTGLRVGFARRSA